MKFSTTIVATIMASLAYGASIADLPGCSLGCLINAAAANGCAAGDRVCTCGPARDNIQAHASPCVLQSCSYDEIVRVHEVAGQICN